MVKARLVWVAKSKIFLNVSWIITSLVHHLLNLNWSEIYPGGGEVEDQEQQIIVVFHSLCQIHSCNIFAGSKAKPEHEAVDRQSLLKLRV